MRALPTEVIEDLHEIFHPASQRNPYRTELIRWRNFTILMLLLHLGLRAGELLDLAAGATPAAADALATRHRVNLSPHDLRHTSAVVRLQRYVAAGLPQQDSEMPLLYARAYFEPRFQNVWDECFTTALEEPRSGLG